LLFLTASLLLVSGPGQAQGFPGLGGSTTNNNGSSLGNVLGERLSNQASGLVGKALPDLSSSSAGNVTGLLSYCIQKKYLKATQDQANSLLGRLTGRDEISSSSGYRLGQQGNLETGNGNVFSLESLQEAAKSKLCDVVLDRAGSLF